MAYILQIQRIHDENLDAHMEALRAALRGAGTTLSELREEDDGFWTLPISAVGIALNAIVELEKWERELPEDVEGPFSWSLSTVCGIERDALELIRIDGRPGSCLHQRQELGSEDAGSIRAGQELDESSADTNRQLILASLSPRRRDLLELMGYEFTVEAAEIDEAAVQRSSRAGNSHLPLVVQAAAACRATAEAKALDVLGRHHEGNPLIVAADTIVYERGRLLGKPRDEEEAYKMLRSLSGHSHQVITAVAVVDRVELSSFVDMTRVQFNPWDDHQEMVIRRSISSGSAMDKAGAYGIQEEGGLLVSSVEGNIYTVVGLPVGPLWRELQLRGVDPQADPDHSRTLKKK